MAQETKKKTAWPPALAEVEQGEPTVAAPVEKKIVGQRPRKDVLISTRSGFVDVKAHEIVRDPKVIYLLQQAKVKLDPVYED